MDLVALLALGDWETATQLVRENPGIVEASGGALHLMAQRNNVPAVSWLLAHGAQVNGRWSIGGADVTPLHVAASRGHAEMLRLLLSVGADPTIRDSMHDGDAIGWAEHFHQPAIVQILKNHLSNT